MFLIKFILIFLVLVNMARNELNSRLPSMCKESEMCIDKSVLGANVFKAELGKFEKCPDARFCYDAESRIRLQDTCGIFLEHGSGLKISGNSLIQLGGNSVLRILDRSFLLNRCNITVNSAGVLISMSEMINDGEIILENKSKIHLDLHSDIQLNTEARISMESESRLEVNDHSWIKMKPLSQTDKDKQVLHLMKKVKVELLTGSSLIQLGGEITIGEGSKVQIWKGGSVHTNGILHFSKDSDVHIEGHLLVGIMTGKRNIGRETNSSLIFAKNGLTLDVDKGKDLWITGGSHCLLKKNIYGGETDKKIEPDTKDEYFDCYSKREDLIEALINTWNTTIAVNY